MTCSKRLTESRERVTSSVIMAHFKKVENGTRKDPLTILAEIYENPDEKAADRIQAAKGVLQYTMIKPPVEKFVVVEEKPEEFTQEKRNRLAEIVSKLQRVEE